jgi:cytochrome c
MLSSNLILKVGVGLSALVLANVAHASDYGQRPEGADFGASITEADLVLWDIDISTPTGGNLPAGQGTVQEGMEIYANMCSACHGDDPGKGGPMYGSMVGGIGSMTERPRKLTPGSMYPYAPILFDYVRRAMPLDNPQSMTANEVYAVSAYLYHLNGLIDKDFVMDAKSMASLKMPNRDAFSPDTRPDTSAERCMEGCAPIGTVADGDHLTK